MGIREGGVFSVIRNAHSLTHFSNKERESREIVLYLLCMAWIWVLREKCV